MHTEHLFFTFFSKWLMFIYKEKVTSVAGCSSWQSHCQIPANASQLAKTGFVFVTSNRQFYLFSANSYITYPHRITGQRTSFNQLLALTVPHWSITKVLRGFISTEVLAGYRRKIPYVSHTSHTASLEEGQSRFPAWLGWRAGGKEEERRYFHCLQQNRNSNSKRPEAEAWEGIMTFLLPHVFKSNRFWETSS